MVLWAAGRRQTTARGPQRLQRLSRALEGHWGCWSLSISVISPTLCLASSLHALRRSEPDNASAIRARLGSVVRRPCWHASQLAGLSVMVSSSCAPFTASTRIAGRNGRTGEMPSAPSSTLVRGQSPEVYAGVIRCARITNACYVVRTDRAHISPKQLICSGDRSLTSLYILPSHTTRLWTMWNCW